LTGLAPRSSSGRLVAGITIPVAVSLAAVAIAINNSRVAAFGPLDAATVLFVVVAPIWLASPIVAGLIWHRLSLNQARLAAVVVGVVAGATVALLFWLVIGSPLDCGFGTVTPAIDFLPYALLVGLFVGSSLGLTGLLVSWLFHTGVRWWAVAVGLGVEIVLLGLGYGVGIAAIFAHGCVGAAPPV
jgi:hypothetical protein